MSTTVNKPLRPATAPLSTPRFVLFIFSADTGTAWSIKENAGRALAVDKGAVAGGRVVCWHVRAGMTKHRTLSDVRSTNYRC